MVAKQAADILTFTRLIIAAFYPLLGLLLGPEGLPWAAVLLAVSWTTDALDGTLARRSSRQYHTWLGDHDVWVDAAVSAGLFAYLVIAGFIPPLVALAYILLWGFLFWRYDFTRNLLMLVQAPVYATLILLALLHARPAGYLLLGWVAVALVITWPRFPQEVVPGFLDGFHRKE